MMNYKKYGKITREEADSIVNEYNKLQDQINDYLMWILNRGTMDQLNELSRVLETIAIDLNYSDTD